jgi:hypothetical protein
VISFDIKKIFFDRKAVTSRVDRATRKVLSKFGAYVRQRAKTSLRKRKKVSEPGKPPSSHTGLLRKLIYFGYDPAGRTVVIGPTPLRSNVEAPPLLEHGGTTTLVRHGKRKIARYRARPFMRPAFEAERPQLPKLWRDSVK